MTATEKLKSYYKVMEWDEGAQFRAIVYAKLMRKFVDEFGEEVLDIAENVRREDGRYSSELSVDIVKNEHKYEEDPAIIIKEFYEDWHGFSTEWGNKTVLLKLLISN
jgi:hypothetical protein